MKNHKLKEVKKHLKEDMKMFEKEKAEDKKLLGKLGLKAKYATKKGK